jgi:hypothetical protein
MWIAPAREPLPAASVIDAVSFVDARRSRPRHRIVEIVVQGSTSRDRRREIAVETSLSAP